jgi:hypothetical protein
MTANILTDTMPGHQADVASKPWAPVQATSLPAELCQALPRREPETLTPQGIRNCRMMRLLDRIAVKFNEAGVPIMALKGAALSLTIYDRPDERAMADLDLMVRAEDLDRVMVLFDQLGALRGEPLVREDFFPKFHYELDLSVGRIYPVKIDLHVRPFRPLRYARVVPADAFWTSAETVRTGHGTILIPSVDEMLIHLMVHASVHGARKGKWMEDIRRWVERYEAQIDWGCFVATADEWQLAWPVRAAIEATEEQFGAVFPPEVTSRLSTIRSNWRDRLTLRQAPRDAEHSFAHVATNLLCAPGLRFKMAYLRAMMIPDRPHMADWYPHRHWGWLTCAHLLRVSGPILARLPLRRRLGTKIETRESRIHGIGVFATHSIDTGQLVAQYHGRCVEQKGTFGVPHELSSGTTKLYELTRKLKYLNHSCRANAKLSKFRLVALRSIAVGEEITIHYGTGACDCDHQSLDPLNNNLHPDKNRTRAKNSASREIQSWTKS